MRLLFLTRSLNIGGAERQLADLATGLRRRGHDVCVATMYGGGAFKQVLEGNGVRVHELHKAGRWDVLPFLWRLVRSVRAQAPDVIHGYLNVPNLLSVALRVAQPRAKIAWALLDTNLAHVSGDWLVRLVFRIAAGCSRLAHWLIVNSTAGREFYASQGYSRSRLVLIPSGIDTDHFRDDPRLGRQVREELRISEDGILVGLVARLVPVKGHRVFLEAAALARRRDPRLRFLCMGPSSPEALQEMKALAGSLGLQECLHWLPPALDVRPVYSAIDLLCSASLTEAFSLSIGEAMACGRPCVVTDVGDSSLLIGDTGRAVPAGNAEALAGAIAGMTSGGREALRSLGLRARARIDEQFSLARLIERTERTLCSPD